MNPNRNPHSPNALRPGRFQPIPAPSVSFLGFFRGEGPPLFPTRPLPGARAGKDPSAPERNFRHNPHSAPENPRNPLRPCPMPLLGFWPDPPFPISENPNIVGIILTACARGGAPGSTRPPEDA